MRKFVVAWHGYKYVEYVHTNAIVMTRNFYGTLRVKEYDRGDAHVTRALVHGVINHGWQYTDPALRVQPISYFGPDSGIARALDFYDQGPRRVGVIGLGVGVFMAWGKPGLIGLHCAHRGADLSYWRLEDGGLRCIYHGWLYDTAGNCLECPAEPEGSKFHLTVKARAYPVREHIGGDGEGAYFPSAPSRFFGVSFGDTLYQASAIFPFSSMRNAERSMPMYVRPYIDFCFQTSYASATAWSMSDSRGKPSPYFVSNFFWAVGLSGLMPRMAVSPTSPAMSRSPHACAVQPGVSAFG